MPVWLAVLLAVGVPLLVAAVTTPLVLWVLARPKVRIEGEPAAYWRILQDEQGNERIHCVVDVSLINGGNEETHITDVRFRLDSDPNGPSFECEPVKVLPENLISKNGGRLKGRLVYRLKKPAPTRSVPHARPLHAFYEGWQYVGTLTVFPSQQRRLILWGEDAVVKQVLVEPVSEDKMVEWLNAEQIDWSSVV